MGLSEGTRIGDWVVENESEASDLYRCHRADMPFRKALVRPVEPRDEGLLQQEAAALTSLDHPNIHGVLGLERSGEDWFLLAEVLQGERLDSFIHQPPLPRRVALDIGLQLADALRAAHARGIPHRNVRPRHVVLSGDGRALLTRFNMRGAVEPVDDDDAYIAPETERSTDVPPTVADQRLDAYAFGVLLYELLTGSRVPGEEAAGRTALSLEVDVPDALRDVVAQLTHPDPEARATVGEAREALVLAIRDSLGDSEPGGAELTYVDDPSPHEERPTPGAIGRYGVIREIGRGGVGVVYEARDPGLQRRVALKVLLAGNFARARDIERFLREARAVAQLDHPNIVRILEFDREDGSAWFAMEFVDGPTLLDRIRSDGPLPWREAVSIAAKLARALAHAHGAGLLHRDVKPNNVLLEEGHRPRLTDFGLAVSTDSADATRLTRTGQVLGTPMYMSPEQAQGDLDAMGPPTDVYGIGVVLYEALTGRPPFEAATPVAIIQEVLEGDPAMPRAIDPGIPRDVEIVCLKAMRRRPRDRYPSAAELADDLERCLSAEPILAAPPSLLDNLRWFVRRNRAAVLAASAALLAATAAGMASVATFQGSERRLEVERQRDASEALEALVERLVQLERDDRIDEVQRAWSTFLEHDEFRNTAAMVDGWLLRADHAATKGDRDARLAALGMAYANASGVEDQERTLMAMGSGLREERQLRGLASVVETVERRLPDRRRSAEIKALQRDALAARRDLSGAAAVGSDTPLGPVLSALSAATPTAHRATGAVAWTDPSAVLALSRGAQRRLTLVGGSPSLPELRTVRIPTGAQRVFSLPTTGLDFLASGPTGGVQLLRDTGPSLVPRRAWSTGPLYTVASGDVDGDGYQEHYLAQGRRLGMLSGAVRLDYTEAHRGTNATNSEINDLVVVDLDGDGDEELVVAAAEWGAYDVRVLGAGPDGLTVEARRKLGVVTDLAVLDDPAGTPTILAHKRDAYPNLRVFSADAPMGSRAGLWRLTLDGGALLPEYQLPAHCQDLQTGDIDGDGIMDAAGTCQGDLMVLVQDADGVLHDLWMEQLTLLALVDLDDDPAMEMVVSDNQDNNAVWVLGAGDATPPVLTTTPFATQEPPPDVGEQFRDMWQRAEELATIGRISQAADAMAQLGELHWGRPGGREAVLRAGDLLDAAGDHAAAAARYQQAAEGAPSTTAVPATRAAARALRMAHDPDGEVQLLRTLAMLVPLDDTEAKRLTVLSATESRPSLELDLREPLDPDWEIVNPLALRREPEGGLRFEAFGQGDIARLPVSWDGGPMELEVDLVVERSEWAAGLEIGLVDVDASGRFLGVEFSGRGGGNVVERWLSCWGGGRTEVLTLPRTEDPMTVGVRLADRRGLTCRATSEAWDDVQSVNARRLQPAERGSWALVLRSTGNPGTLVRGVLQGIRVRGVAGAHTTATERPAAHRARLALVDGDPGLAARIGKAAGVDPLFAVALAAETDDGAALAAALRDERTPGSRILSHLLHCRLEGLAPELRPLLGSAWPYRLAEAWGTTFASHGTDPEVVRILLRHLDGLDEVQPSKPGEIETLVVLHERRGVAAIQAGRVDVARASLDRALALHTRLAAEAPERAAALDGLVAGVHLERAALATLVDPPDLDAALSAMRHAMAVSPAPEILADMAAARPELAALRSLPGWVTWVEPVRAGQRPAR